jgi:hypothetical protein
MSLARTFRQDAQAIEVAIEGMDTAGQHMCEFAQEAGDRLIRVKEGLPHGQWGKWLKENFTRTPRFANILMKFATEAREMECVTPKLLKEHWDAILHPEGTTKKDKKQIRSTASHLDENQTGEDDVIEAEIVPELPTVDALGREIPEDLRPVFAETTEFKAFAHALSTLKKKVHAAAEQNPDAWLMVTMQQFDEGIANARRVMAQSGPYAVCSYCGGKHSKKCRGCRGAGFLDKIQYQAVPEELKP